MHLGVENIHKVGAIGVPGWRWECKIVDENGKELLDKVPIWSDSRAVEESRTFFAKTDPQRWYNLTGPRKKRLIFYKSFP